MLGYGVGDILVVGKEGVMMNRELQGAEKCWVRTHQLYPSLLNLRRICERIILYELYAVKIFQNKHIFRGS